MFVYEKKLQFPVKIATPNPKLAAMIISQYGGPDGELGASMRYLSQRYSMPYAEAKGLLTDIGTEELGHMEMVAALVHQLTRNLTDEQVRNTPAFAPYFVDHTAGVYPTAASGFPWTAGSIQSTGDVIADLTEDLAAEQKARLTYDNILRLSDDPDVNNVIRFLREREIVHFQRFGECLRLCKEKMDARNVYLTNPASNKQPPPPRSEIPPTWGGPRTTRGPPPLSISSDTENIKESYLSVWIGGQRPQMDVLAVGGQKNLARIASLSGLLHHQTVGKGPIAKTQLDKVPWQQFLRRDRSGQGARSLPCPGEESEQVLHPGPGGGPVPDRAVVPAEGGGEVHHPRPGIQTLGGKVGAVAPQGVKVIVGGISAMGPAAGIADRRLAVIGQKFRQTPLLPSPLSYAAGTEGIKKGSADALPFRVDMGDMRPVTPCRRSPARPRSCGRPAP